MGIGARVMTLLQICDTVEKRKALIADANRLVIEMGNSYKFCAITSGSSEIPYPFNSRE